MKARWLLNKFKPFGYDQICFVDEPILSAFGSSTYVSVQRTDVVSSLNEVVESIHNDGALVGTHCCGNTEWSILIDAGVDIISFDAYEFGETIGYYPGKMNAFFEQYHEIIPEFPQFQEILNKAIPKHLRVNRLKVKPKDVICSLAERGISLKRSIQCDDTLYSASMLASPGNLLEYYLGHIHPQAFTSCLCSIVLQPERESYLLDMCASPGGKTSHLAQMMNDSGLIIANELYPNRHVPLGNTLDRMGVLNAIITGYQAQEFPLKHRFDYILADVPCSGEGTFRNTKKSNAAKNSLKMNHLPDLQKKIILRGFDLLKENGEMLYATCTYNPEENESVVDFLLKNRRAKLLPIEIGIDHDPGIIKWQRNTYEKQIERCARFYPHRVDSVGFFMARIGRC